MTFLAELASEHGGALNYDMMTRLGARVDDVPGLVSWKDLRDFVTNLPADSALFRDMHPEMAGWDTIAQVNTILADMYDSIEGLSHMYASSHVKRTLPRPKRFPRPFSDDDGDEQRMGSGAIPVCEFEDWWNSFD